MADYLKSKFNPVSGYEDDVCIFVIGVGPNGSWGAEPLHSYHDVMDTDAIRMSRVRRHAHGSLIAISKTHAQVLKDYFKRDDIYLIPQHHCNFRREQRRRKSVIQVGCIGGDSAIQWPHYAVGEMLGKYGLGWHFESRYWRREYVIEFYKSIDIQLSWRPTHARGLSLSMNSLKLSNAGSFGIPTVSYPEPAYLAEWPNECLWANTMTELVEQAAKLRDDATLYDEMSNRARVKAEEYHIENIAKLYQALPGVDQ